jgi:HSP20 family protein
MALYYSNPFDAMLEFQRTLDQLRESSWLEFSTSGRGAFPPLNVFSKGDDIVIVAEVPGVRKADLKVEAKDNVVRIAGAKSVAYGERASLHRRERGDGRFDRTVQLPVEVDADRIKAECRDGILALYLPRAESAKPRTISIN